MGSPETCLAVATFDALVAVYAAVRVDWREVPLMLAFAVYAAWVGTWKNEENPDAR